MDEIMVGVKVKLESPDSFLLVKETLTRIGVSSKKNKTLYQSCHILHKRGEYFVIHFKELFKLDGKPTDISEDDIHRRNLIAHLLQDWGLLTVVNPEQIKDRANMNSVKVLAFHEKMDWSLEPKYTIGNK